MRIYTGNEKEGAPSQNNSLENFVDERDFKLLEKDKYSFSVLHRVISGKCELLLSDHERVIICFTGQPFPVWIWTPEDLPEKDKKKIYKLVKEHSFLDGKHRFNLKYNLAEFFIKKTFEEGKRMAILMNMFAYQCKELIEPEKRADGNIHRCGINDIDKLADFIRLFDRELNTGRKEKESYLSDASRLVETGNMFLWRNARGESVASCNYVPDGNLASISFVFTKPECRRRHYAINLVYEVTKIIMESGYLPHLYTDADNTASNACYEKIGYVVKGKLCTIG